MYRLSDNTMFKVIGCPYRTPFIKMGTLIEYLNIKGIGSGGTATLRHNTSRLIIQEL